MCRTLAHKGCDAGVPARIEGATDVTCPEYEHVPRAEEVPVADRFGVRARFDDEERSTTHAQLVGRYPGCGAWPNADAPLTAHVLAAHEEACQAGANL